MKTGRKVVMLSVALIVLAGMLCVLGCGGGVETTTSQSAAPATTAQSVGTTISQGGETTTSQAAETTTVAAPTKTLTIGIITPTSNSRGLEISQQIQLMGDMDNAKGGVEIGGEKYKVEFIVYDSELSQAGETAAANRLIYEDKVKFIIASGDYFSSWVDVSEQNKVIVGSDVVFSTALLPQYHYTYQGGFGNPSMSIVCGWLCENMPDAVKNVVLMTADNQIGHMVSDVIQGPMFKAFGVDMQTVYYPEGATDLSAAGTKVMSMNPTAVMAAGGGDVVDGLALKAAYQAGYRGLFFNPGSNSVEVLSTVIPIEALEGYIGGASPTEFDPPLTDAAKEYKDAWFAKYGEPLISGISNTAFYSALIAAMQVAGTTEDTDKIMAVLHGGLEYSAPCGTGKMIARPDLGNNDTVDSISETYVKKIVDGKATLLDTISVEDGLVLFQKAAAAAAAAAPKP
jgi:branched-chain amino acid transport system substrate-binding protein